MVLSAFPERYYIWPRDDGTIRNQVWKAEESALLPEYWGRMKGRGWENSIETREGALAVVPRHLTTVFAILVLIPLSNTGCK